MLMNLIFFQVSQYFLTNPHLQRQLSGLEPVTMTTTLKLPNGTHQILYTQQQPDIPGQQVRFLFFLK